ncbi:DNA primase family protein [Cupriavidus campinensis]|uniref:DNA primase family protein n=1 Tax=Cupriavidus campinensis TaxID=151783 RepID=UPI001656842C|nr:phage/plasmid primase, P4 family [Cupriavidus campinensis]
MLQWAAVSKLSKVPQWIVARAFLDAQFPEGAACVGKLFYGYDQGIFRLIDESELMQRLLQTFGYGIKVSDAQQMLKYIKFACRMSPDTFRSDARLVCFRNGTLNVETGELGLHSPDHRLVSQINADYVPTAECPRFLRFLEEVFRNDEDREQRIRFLRQWMGYLLIPDASLQKMLFLLGRGANGKSVLCKVIESMLGSENVSHAMLNRLGRPAVRVELAGKLANISPDLPAQALTADGYLKAIVAGDSVEAERKYSDSCTITPFCRLMVATNSMPDTPDRSDGFFRRVIILKFNRQFSEEEQEAGLLEALRAEMEGIIVWAMGGFESSWLPVSSRFPHHRHKC